ncbi:DUF4296 domain-containing protein [Algibacter sp. 2305UL17-15]|uniref:DUF4296 domain-containing protein n=1 Tax=Algibacter sp. 2305UL17-15 TaxID=3231268 RepID=UPI003457E5BD
MMLKKIILLFCVLIGVASCYKYNKPDKPEHLISKDEMVNILIDLRLMASVTGRDKKVLDSANVIPEQYIYQKYNIDSTSFAESNAYYAYYLDDYKDIYGRVKDSLTILKNHYKEILEEERKAKKEKDSLKRLEKDLELIEIEPEIELELEEAVEAEEGLIPPVSNKDLQPE